MADIELTEVIIHNALIDTIIALEKQLKRAERERDDAYSIIHRLEDRLVDASEYENDADWEFALDDHQLYDDLQCIPAPKEDTP